MNRFILMMAMLGLVGCSSAPVTKTAEIEPDKVLSRIDDLTKRPSYIKESEPFRVEHGVVISTGVTTIPGSDRVEAAYRISQNNAKSHIASAIEQRLEFIFQNAEEGTAINSTQARYIGAEASQLVTSSLRIDKNYWEKIATTADSGERITQYKVISTVTMPEADFRRAILDASRRAQGKGGLSQDFAKKVDAQWDKFVGQAPQENRTPTEATTEKSDSVDE